MIEFFIIERVTRLFWRLRRERIARLHRWFGAGRVFMSVVENIKLRNNTLNEFVYDLEIMKKFVLPMVPLKQFLQDEQKNETFPRSSDDPSFEPATFLTKISPHPETYKSQNSNQSSEEPPQFHTNASESGPKTAAFRLRMVRLSRGTQYPLSG